MHSPEISFPWYPLSSCPVLQPGFSQVYCGRPLDTSFLTSLQKLPLTVWFRPSSRYFLQDLFNEMSFYVNLIGSRSNMQVFLLSNGSQVVFKEFPNLLWPLPEDKMSKSIMVNVIFQAPFAKLVHSACMLHCVTVCTVYDSPWTSSLPTVFDPLELLFLSSVFCQSMKLSQKFDIFF